MPDIARVDVHDGTLVRFLYGSRIRKILVLNHKNSALFVQNKNITLGLVLQSLHEVVIAVAALIKTQIRADPPLGTQYSNREIEVALFETARLIVYTEAFEPDVDLDDLGVNVQILKQLFRSADLRAFLTTGEC